MKILIQLQFQIENICFGLTMELFLLAYITMETIVANLSFEV